MTKIRRNEFRRLLGEDNVPADVRSLEARWILFDELFDHLFYQGPGDQPTVAFKMNPMVDPLPDLRSRFESVYYYNIAAVL